MSKFTWAISVYLASSIIGCSKGSSSHPSCIHSTQYDLQNYLFDVSAQTNNCVLEGSSVLNCNSKGTFGGIYSISFKTPESKPGAYVVMPILKNTYGLKIIPISGCRQVASHGNETYLCNFTISANGTAQAGGRLHIKLSGELGDANIVTVNIR